MVMYLLGALEAGVDIAIKSRWLNPVEIGRTQPLFRRVASRVFNLLADHILNLPFKDTQCGLKALTRHAADRVFPLLGLNCWEYDLELIHVAIMQRLRIVEVDLDFVHDYSDSRFRPFRDGLAAVVDLFRIRWNDISGLYGSDTLGQTFSRSVKRLVPGVVHSPRMYADQLIKREIAERGLEVQDVSELRAPSKAASTGQPSNPNDVAA